MVLLPRELIKETSPKQTKKKHYRGLGTSLPRGPATGFERALCIFPVVVDSPRFPARLDCALFFLDFAAGRFATRRRGTPDSKKSKVEANKCDTRRRASPARQLRVKSKKKKKKERKSEELKKKSSNRNCGSSSKQTSICMWRRWF